MIPSIDYTQIDGPQWLAAFPDSPIQIGTGTGLTLGLSSTTFNWTDHNVPPNMLGSLMFGTLHIYEREINLRLDIVFQIGQLGRIYPMIATLNQMIDSVRETVRLMREGAVSS